MQRLWLAITPLLFLLLWSAGYVVAKVALVDAAPMALLALRFAAVIAIMAALFAILRPPLPKTLSGYLHLGFVGVLMQTVYFGMAYFSFVNGVAAGTAALIFSLQPILVALLAPRWTGERSAGCMVWPCDCHDRHPHGHRRASGDWAAAAGRLWFCRIGLSRHNPRDPLGKTLWLVASPGERQFDWL